MAEHSRHVEVRPGSERSFGFTFAAVSLFLGCWPMLAGAGIRWGFIASAVVFGLLSVFAPQVFKLPNRLWFKLGMALGAIVAPVVMALVFILAFVPMGLFARLRGMDPLERKIDKAAPSYWHARVEQMQSMKRQF
jgi:Saxitoxin biosynthesis operon protein SxtJ